MPQVMDIVRQRRKRATHTARPSGRGLGFRVGLAGLSAMILTAILILAFLQAEITAGLPPVTTLDSHFGPIGRERYQPVRFYDRSGEIVLYQAFNPDAEGSRWLYIQEGGPIDIQEHTLQALLAAIDPEFLSRASPTTIRMASDFIRIGLQGASLQSSIPIPQALVEAQLNPLDADDLPDHIEQARTHLLAQELIRRYPKTKLLEWFINSIDFGRDAYGLDAAAMVYL
ncbi:MAG: hypothetical protein E4G99_02675, partial [Anaerolineales bacterium]